MNKINASLLSIALLTSVAAFAQETCQEGFFCVQHDSQIILRAVNQVQDHNLISCQEITLKNYGSDVQSCLSEASIKSAKPTPVLASCSPEAQIIAKVYQAEKTSLGSCVVHVSEIKMFNPNQTCRLEIKELTNGIEVGMKSGHDCAYEIGDDLSGVLIKNSAGIIHLQ